jgi:hypothetical protein
MSTNTHRTLRTVVTEWWKNLSGSSADESCLTRFDRTAKELGFTSEELLDISLQAYHTTDLLPLRMALLHLDADRTARTDPCLYNKLAKSCRLCDVKGQCASDIIRDTASRQWQEYCPNAAALRTMQSQNASRSKCGDASPAS